MKSEDVILPKNSWKTAWILIASNWDEQKKEGVVNVKEMVVVSSKYQIPTLEEFKFINNKKLNNKRLKLVEKYAHLLGYTTSNN